MVKINFSGQKLSFSNYKRFLMKKLLLGHLLSYIQIDYMGPIRRSYSFLSRMYSHDLLFKLLILVDIIYTSVTTRDSGLEIVPTRNLQDEKRLEIITLVTGHVRRLVKQMKKKSENFGKINRNVTRASSKSSKFRWTV